MPTGCARWSATGRPSVKKSEPVAAAATRKAGGEWTSIQVALLWTIGALLISLALWWAAFADRIPGLRS